MNLFKKTVEPVNVYYTDCDNYSLERIVESLKTVDPLVMMRFHFKSKDIRDDLGKRLVGLPGIEHQYMNYKQEHYLYAMRVPAPSYEPRTTTE